MKKLFIPLFLLILINCKKSDNQQEIKSDLVEIISEDKVMDINASPAQEIPVDAMVSAKAVNTEPKSSPSHSNNVIVKKIIKD